MFYQRQLQMCLTIEVLTSEILSFFVTEKLITMYPLLQVSMVNRVFIDINEFYNNMFSLPVLATNKIFPNSNTLQGYTTFLWICSCQNVNSE